MSSLHVYGKTPCLRVVLRVLLAFVITILFTIMVALLRGTCHLSSCLIGFAILLLGVVVSNRMTKKNSYLIKDGILSIEEHFIGHKMCRFSIPISQIDMCVMHGSYPFHSIELSVHGRRYVLRNVASTSELVQMINDLMEK